MSGTDNILPINPESTRYEFQGLIQDLSDVIDENIANRLGLLEGRINKQFGGIDKRVKAIDARFEKIEAILEQIQHTLDIRKSRGDKIHPLGFK